MTSCRLGLFIITVIALGVAAASAQGAAEKGAAVLRRAEVRHLPCA